MKNKWGSITQYKNGVQVYHHESATKYDWTAYTADGARDIALSASQDIYKPDWRKCVGDATICGYNGYASRYQENAGTLTSLIFEGPRCDGGAPWSAWSACTQSCDGGEQKRSRKRGSDDIEESQPCNQQECPSWSAWSQWTKCTKTCGTGVQSQTRHKQDEEDDVRTQDCNVHECPTWTTWSAWTSCNNSCGGGEQISTRTKDDEEPQTKKQPCNEQNCPSWSGWSEWSPCDKSCGGGEQISYNYKEDEETQVKKQVCNTQTCHTTCPHKEMHLIPATEPCLPQFALEHKQYKGCWAHELYRLCLIDYSFKYRKCRRLRKKFGPFKDLDDAHARHNQMSRRAAGVGRRRAQNGTCYKYCEGLDTFDTLNSCVKFNKKAAKKNMKKIKKGKNTTT